MTNVPLSDADIIDIASGLRCAADDLEKLLPTLRMVGSVRDTAYVESKVLRYREIAERVLLTV